MENVIETFTNSLNQIPEIYKTSAGAARNASGLAYENLIKNLLVLCNLVGEKNDYFKSEEIDGYQLDNLQVDWHVYKDGELFRFVESKTYLDRCYLERAVCDFISLLKSPDVTNDNVECAIFAGQNATTDNAIGYFKAKFKKETGKDLKIFFMHDSKRKSNKGIYKQENLHLFELNKNSLNEFVQWLNR